MKLYKEKNHKICKLAMAKLIIPMTTVSYERRFSALNFIKNEYRSRLSEENLDHALIVTIEGPSFNEFYFIDTYAYWHNKHDWRTVFIQILETTSVGS